MDSSLVFSPFVLLFANALMVDEKKNEAEGSGATFWAAAYFMGSLIYTYSLWGARSCFAVRVVAIVSSSASTIAH